MPPPPRIRVRGITQPARRGQIVGRAAAGIGDLQFLDAATLGQQLIATGTVGTPGSGGVPLTVIPNQRLLGNGSGGSAIPVALSVTMPAAGLTIAWAAGGITFALANDLLGVEGLATNGLATRTAANTWTTRTITGTASRISLSNGDGVAGNPTIDIDAAYVGQTSIVTLGTVTTGTWNAGTVSSHTNSSAARPASTTTAGWTIESNYAGFGEVDFWNTVNSSGAPNQGFYFYQKTGAATEILMSAMYADATLTQFDFYSSTVAATFGATAGSEVFFGSISSHPVTIYAANVARLQLPITGGLKVYGTTSGDLTIKAAAVAGTNTITLPAGTTDFSATGATGAFVKQASVGAAFTVAVPTVGELAGLGAGVATFLATPSSANFAAAVTGETGTAGGVVFSSGPTIDAALLTGDVSIGSNAAPTAHIFSSGTYTSANSGYSAQAGILASSATTIHRAFYLTTIVQPTGATLNNIYGIDSQVTVGVSTPATITAGVAVRGTLATSAAFLGTISFGYQFYAADPSVGGGTITNVAQFAAATLTTNNALAAGTSTLRGFWTPGITAGAAGGTINARGVDITVPSGTAPASGTVNNRGIFISGNGGAAPGGTGVVNNFAIFSDSTANSQLGLALLQIGGGTASFPALKRSTTHLQVRLADDSAFAPVDASEIDLQGATSGAIVVKAAAVAGANTLTLPAGTTDFSATGATGAYVKQASAGAAFTVAVPTIAEIAGLGANVATFLATPSSANLAAAVTDETGTAGKLVFDTSPKILTPDITGTATNNNAAAGSVGEYLTGSATAVSLTSPNTSNIVTLSVTAGDWDIEGWIKFNPAATTTSTIRAAGVTATSATMPTTLADATAWQRDLSAITVNSTPAVMCTGYARISLASTTNIFLVAAATFATSTMTADGILKARRRR